MSTNLLRILLRHGVRNVRHGGLPFFFATLMTGLGLFGLATFATVLINFQRLADGIGDRVGAVVFLDVKDAASAEDVRAKISFIPGVRDTELVPPEVAMSKVRKALGETGSLLDGAAGVSLPWIVEVTPELAGEMSLDVVLDAIGRLSGVEEVQHPGGDMTRIRALLKLLKSVGVFLTLLIALVTVVVVSNTVKLTLFARRDEIAIMKLVGATDLFVRVPFLFEGLAQGILGASLALVGVYLAHASLAGILRVIISGVFGVFDLSPLPLVGAVWVVIGGAALGLFGAGVSIGRFLRV